MRYEDFVIQIDSTEDGQYSARVVESPAGQGKSAFKLPWDRDELPFLVAGLGRDVRESGSAPPGSGPGGWCVSPRDLAFVSGAFRSESGRLTPHQFGVDLFESLFSGDIRKLFDHSCGQIRRNPPETGLRIHLKLDPRDPFLARCHSLPWELLRHSDTGEDLALDLSTPIVRSLDVLLRRPRPPVHASRLRILVVVSSPAHCQSLDLSQEQQNIHLALKGHSGLELTFMKGDFEALHERLAERPFHVLHFMGHGHFDRERGEAALLFEAQNGSPIPVSGPKLATELGRFPSLQLILLNACDTARLPIRPKDTDPFTGVATALVRAGLPAVVAMQFPISDPAAIRFSREFYHCLVEGRSIVEATTEGRQSIHRAPYDSFEWSTPVLFLPSKATDHPTFQVVKTTKRWMLSTSLVLMASALTVFAALLLGSHSQMVTIQPGPEAGPAGPVATPFQIDRHEVTVARYMDFARRADIEPPPDPLFEGMPDYFTEPRWGDYPVINVTWPEAERFCRALGQRLPTRAEWWTAAGAIGSSVDRLFLDSRGVATGNHPDRSLLTVYPEYKLTPEAGRDGYPFTAPVGSFSPNRCGVFDLDGNVSEWCADPGPELGGRPLRNLSSDSRRFAVCGPSWAERAPHYQDFWSDAERRSKFLGFRCAADVAPSATGGTIWDTIRP